jgi:hypothetical protein
VNIPGFALGEETLRPHPQGVKEPGAVAALDPVALAVDRWGRIVAAVPDRLGGRRVEGVERIGLELVSCE